MDTVDRDLTEAERDASPERFPSITQYKTELSVPVSSSDSSLATPEGRHALPSRTRTRNLDLHPTELLRIQTLQSQHRSTVGATARSRRNSTKEPWPGFGAGKPYPPFPPDREGYVVEFLGPGDPLHAQNWPTWKKCVWNNLSRLA